MLKDIQMDLSMSSITSVGALANFCKTPEYMNVKFIGKEDVKECQEDKEEGYSNKIDEYKKAIRDYVKDLENQAVQDV